ncbi:MAG: hypothetical protein RJA52_220 [Bacteroidota bacterium]|jgi:hypothetical protein
MNIVRNIFSFLTNPVFTLFYLFLIVSISNPQSFGIPDVFSEEGKILLIKTGINSIFLPFLAILLFKGLGFSKSLKFEDKKERIVPYIIVATFYLWTFINVLKNGGFPLIYKVGILGILIALFLSFLINLQVRISAHVVGFSSLIFFLLIHSGQISFNEIILGGEKYTWGSYLIPLLLVVLGLLVSLRNWDNQRSPREIFGAIGIAGISQLFSTQVIHIFLFVN